MELSLNSPEAKYILEYIRNDLAELLCAEKKAYVFKEHQTFYCAYVTQAFWYKARVYVAEPCIEFTKNSGEAKMRAFGQEYF